MPQLSLEEGNFLEVIYQLKLVGLVLTSDLSWNSHIDYTIKRVNGVLWQLTRFRNLGAPTDKLIQFYILKIRSILMFGSVCFHSSLTQELSQKLELQQRRSLAVILGSQYRSYRHALSVTSLPRLDLLREEACLKWVLRAQSNPLYTEIFPLNTSVVDTRFRPKFREYKCVSMTRALNQHYSKTNYGELLEL